MFQTLTPTAWHRCATVRVTADPTVLPTSRAGAMP